MVTALRSAGDQFKIAKFFSYRFEPQSDHWLYNRDVDWNAFGKGHII
jgi:hypothetical protein